MGFPSQGRGFPGPRPLPRRRGPPKPRAPHEEVPEDERTHVPVSRFKLGCGLPRIGIEKALVVLDRPTCPACGAALAKRRKDQEVLRRLAEGFGEANW